MSLAAIIKTIWARKLTFFLSFAFITGSGIVFSFLVTPMYQSEALLMVSEGRSQQNPYPEMLRYKINSQLYVIESEDVVRQAIATIGPRTLLPALEPLGVSSLNDLAFLKLRKRLVASVEKESQVLKLTFRHEDPEIAKNFLKAVIDAFLEREVNLSGSAEAPAFFRRQAANYRIVYESASARLSEFSKGHSIYSISQEVELALSRRDEILATRATALGAIAEKEGQVATLQNTLSQLRRRISLPSEVVGPNVNMPSGSDPLVNNRVPANESPLLLVRVFQETAQSLVNLNAAIVGLRSLEASQKNALDAVEVRLVSLSAYKAEFERLKNEVDQASTILDAHVKRVADAQLNADWDASEKLSNVKVMQPATVPLKPVFPQKGLFITLASLVGLIGGAALTAGLSLLLRPHNRLHSLAAVLQALSPNLEPQNFPIGAGTIRDDGSFRPAPRRVASVS